MSYTQRSPLLAISKFLALPFCAGNVGIRENDNNNPDGSTSSTVTLATVLSITFVIVGIYSGKQTKEAVAHALTWGMIMGFVAMGLVFCVVVSVTTYRNKSYWLDQMFHDADPSLKMKVFFLWVFGFGMILQTTINISIDIECLYDDAYGTVNDCLGILSSFVMITYLCLQMGFITYFKNNRFVNSVSTNYCLTFIMLPNLAIWLNSVVNDIKGTYYVTNNSNTSVILNETQCYWNSTIQGLFSELIPYLIPLRMEFCLLATCFLLKLRPYNGPIFEVEQDRFSNQNLNNENEYREQENDELLPTLDNQSIGLQIHHIVAGIIALFINIPPFMVTIIYYFTDESNNVLIFSMYLGFFCANKSIILVLALIAFYILSQKNHKCSNRTNTMTTGDYILTLGSTGSITYACITIVSTLSVNLHFAPLVATNEVISLFSTYMQTILIIHARMHRNCYEKNRVIDSVFLILLICNLTVWFANTCVGVTDSPISEGQVEFIGHTLWKSAEHIFFSLIIFYRFYAGSEFYGLFRQFGKRTFR